MTVSNHSYVASESSARELPRVVGSGVLRERIISVPYAAALEIAGPLQAEIRVEHAARDDASVCFRADDNVLPLCYARLVDGVIRIGLHPAALENVHELTVTAQLGPLTRVTTRSTAQTTIEGLCGDNVALSSRAVSRLRAQGRVRRWSVDAADAGQVHLAMHAARHTVVSARAASLVTMAGQSEALRLHCTGNAVVRAAAPDFETSSAELQLDGASNVQLRARDRVVGNLRAAAFLELSCPGRVSVEGYRRNV